MRQIARITAVILLTLTGLLLAWIFRSVILLVLLSVIIAASIRPLIQQLAKHGIPLIAAQIIIYFSCILFVISLFIAAGPRLAVEIGEFSNWLITEHQRLHAVWLSGAPWQQAIAGQMMSPNELYAALLGDNGQLFLRATFGLVQSFATLTASFLFVLFLSVYWNIDQGHFERLWLSLLSVEVRVKAREGWRQIETEIGNFVRSEITQFIIATFLLAIGYYLIGVRFPLLLSIMGGLSLLLPVVGVVLIFVPILIIGLISGGYVALLAMGYTYALFIGLHYLIEPQLHDRSRYSGITLLLVMIPLVDSFGLMGFVIAPPLAIFLQLLFAGLVRFNLQSYETAVQLNQIEKRLHKIKFAINGDADRSPEMENFLSRLQHLIEKAQTINPNSSRQRVTKEVQ